MNRLLPHLMLYAALLAAPAARAQGYVGLGLDYSMTTAPLINFANMAVMNNNSMNTGLHSRGKAARMEAPPAVQRNARELAKVFPASSQAAMAQAFQQSMDVYQQVAAKMGWQRDDLDGAMAAFIVGNYMVFANREVPDEEFAAVAEQLRQGRHAPPGREAKRGNNPQPVREKRHGRRFHGAGLQVTAAKGAVGARGCQPAQQRARKFEAGVGG